jgi:hypothetical protein
MASTGFVKGRAAVQTFKYVTLSKAAYRLFLLCKVANRKEDNTLSVTAVGALGESTKVSGILSDVRVVINGIEVPNYKVGNTFESFIK